MGATKFRMIRLDQLNLPQPGLRAERNDRSVVAALQKGEIEMRTARALLPLKGDGAAQRRLVARILKERLSAGEVTALVAALLYGERGVAPLRYVVAGSGRVEARTTRSGKLRVVLEADDRKSLERLWRSLSKKLG